jgi:GNAT superfamily N-acetyltransferase
MLTPTFVTTPEELHQIARLSQDNLATTITPEKKIEEGYVTWPYTPDILGTLHAIAPSVIVKDGDRLAGYAIVLTRECAAVYPPIENAIRQFSAIRYKGRPLLDYCVYFMGQICVDQDYRGKGVFRLLYEFHRQQFYPQYEMLVTEVSTSNPRSLRAHLRIGFTIADTHRDEIDEWNVILWDWT